MLCGRLVCSRIVSCAVQSCTVLTGSGSSLVLYSIICSHLVSVLSSGFLQSFQSTAESSQNALQYKTDLFIATTFITEVLCNYSVRHSKHSMLDELIMWTESM